ncbi:Tectonic-3 [Dissostichus eleginoides]|uniref:Tectonic-3 n=1 Tax=Dissostichus eleginoides TaxID=100907 RepID=A0AAD9BF34_DISEL|nr:Tectonic-3 [Dissostichus eleginoides]
MNPRRWCPLVLIFSVVLCGRSAHAATDPSVTSTVTPSPTGGGSFSSETPAPGGKAAEDFTGVSTTEAVTPDPMTPTESPAGDTESPSMVTENPSMVTESPAVVTESPAEVTGGPPVTTVQPLLSSEGCLCDLTPDFCDIGCCCDTVDCGIANLSTVFTGCPQKAISGVCIEKWLMFRANVNTSLVTVTDSLFCVRPEDKSPQSLPAPQQLPPLGDSYHFSPPAPLTISYSRGFYRVDDVIQTYLSNSSARGFLRQPSPGAASAFCISRNPAKFMRRNSQRPLLLLHLNLIKTPIVETEQISDFLIPVTPLSEWPAPSEHNSSCVNVVKNVEIVIGYTGRGEVTYATVNVVLADADPNQSLLQTHSVQFKLASPSPTQGDPTSAVGLRVGSPVIGRFDGEVKPSGSCSSDPDSRAPVLFTHNSITGCTFSSPSSNCSELRSQIYGLLQGLPDWTRVIAQECPVSLEETCESGCVLPNSLAIQVLWARQGLLDLPQKYILGAKYLFQCQSFKCPLSSSIILTAEVTFVDTTLYPEPPRGLPQPNWKFPFGFFTRGTSELDGNIVINGSDAEKVTWSLTLFTVMLLTGLDFLTR